jgi:DNA-binding NarL/FixJ family response regulator
VVVDDHELARESLKFMLSDAPGIEIVGEAENGLAALAACSRLLPDLVLMDVRMPGMDGLTATRELKKKHPKTSVLMLTMHDNPDYLLEALKAGASGYVLKDAAEEDVIAAVGQVREGESPLDPKLAARLLRRMATGEGGRKGERKAQPLAQPLTSRELEVLGFLKLGRTNRQIAEELYISVGTVKNHVEHIIQKLGVSDRTQAVVRSLEMGLLDLSG